MTVNPPVESGVPHPGSGRGGGAGAGAIVALVLGILFALIGVGGIIGSTASAALLPRPGQDGFLTSPIGEVSTTSYGLTTPPAHIGVNAVPFNLGSLRFAAESAAPGGQIFIGIGPDTDVDRYLSGIHTTEITGVRISPFRVQVRDVPGSAVPAPPTGQSFWAVSAYGPGMQQVTMDLRSGDWVLVIMNADAGAGITADVQAAVNPTLFGTLTAGLWIGGIVALIIGAALIAIGATLLGRRLPAPATGNYGQAKVGAHYPARLTGHLDPQLSRGLWLVKWLLAVPHFIILFFLWFVVGITTIISGFAILFTGRYPRPLFDFAVGVLRWSWRVAFYSYSALATDAYPPFTLASTDYPADFDVDYPERLSHGLVLVKGWLLAIPHLLIVSVFTGTAWASWSSQDSGASDYGRTTGFSLLGLLVLIAAVILMFTGRYQRPLFDVVMGINRWIYRVATYTLLLRDEYPPFRLDQGPNDPITAEPPTGTSSPPPIDALGPPLE